MKAVRVPVAPEGDHSFTTSNPAPSSSLRISDVLQPMPSHPGEILVRIKATTIIRDNLTWPELYADHPAQLGNDFAGVVVSTYNEADSSFKAGDHVYGMLSAHKGGAWAEYAVVTEEEASLKPDQLSWEEAAALPLSALTADQALFEKAGLDNKVSEYGRGKRVLVTGAAGGVGTYLVQFALAAGLDVVGATSSLARHQDFLKSLGVHETTDYAGLSSTAKFDAIIDTVGGDILRRCWTFVKADGVIVSIDSASWNFVDEHTKLGYSKGKEMVRAMFFIVEPSQQSMARISEIIRTHELKIFVASVMPLARAREGYDLVESGKAGRGKVILVP